MAAMSRWIDSARAAGQVHPRIFRSIVSKSVVYTPCGRSYAACCGAPEVRGWQAAFIMCTNNRSSGLRAHSTADVMELEVHVTNGHALSEPAPTFCNEGLPTARRWCRSRRFLRRGLSSACPAAPPARLVALADEEDTDSAPPWYYEQQQLYCMTDLQAASACRRSANSTATRHAGAEIAAYYDEQRRLSHRLSLNAPGERTRSALHLYVVLWRPRHDATESHGGAAQRGVGSQVHYIPSHGASLTIARERLPCRFLRSIPASPRPRSSAWSARSYLCLRS